MNEEYRKILRLYCEDIVPNLEIKRLWPKLIDNKVFKANDVNIPRWKDDITNEATIRDIYSTIETRGPDAFSNFIKSLRQSDHNTLADILESRIKGIVPVNEIRPTKIVERTQNSFFDIQKFDEPVEIKVEKATTFLDEPGSENILKYPMRKKPHGLVLIITNIDYKKKGTSRYSAIYDEQNLQLLFEQMGFKVITYRNLTREELLKNVEEFSRHKDLKLVDSCFVVISSHGNMNTEYEVTEIRCVSPNTEHEAEDYNVKCVDILEYFTTTKCPALAGKPKVFMFQLCRGDEKQKSTEHRSAPDGVNCTPAVDKTTAITSRKVQRTCEDTLLVYATLPGHVAFRDVVVGSWFIQIFCIVCMKHAKDHHFLDLLHMVDELLKSQRTKNDECQTLVVTSVGFNKHLYLNPGLFEYE